ncbi:hypothetical protein ISN45_Aa06g024150 [Arabidopsis thaliana x Arabidopsis arenosa]|uniref:60S acidic ribosomal protein P1 n=2 Tax=Arabidopsis TaxID=3701 RepID=A0A8T1ZDQ6_ARASU|nr:hypothetical protein ISN45_Aa06g024150 [Arabidopsis thaliana x Arabidopsis arenosa]KAG7556363.1 hypothetical protein ISN44_As11g024030 [Arabidopsis suecica]
MSTSELACTYAALILHDDGIEITAENISKLVKTANVNVESYWPSLFAKLCEKKNIDDLIMNVGAGGCGSVGPDTAAAPAASQSASSPKEKKNEKEEIKEESEDDMIIGLFD